MGAVEDEKEEAWDIICDLTLIRMPHDDKITETTYRRLICALRKRICPTEQETMTIKFKSEDAMDKIKELT